MATFAVAKASMQRQITTLRNQLQTQEDIADLRNRFTKLEVKFDQFNNKYIDDINDNEYEQLVTIQNYFYETKKMADLTMKPVVAEPKNPELFPVKLPRLNLPIFDGSLDEWRAFFDIFSLTIHDNDHLSPSQKFQYLKLSLKNKPLQLINSLMLCDSNYDVAWNILLSRYNNNNLIINHHLKNMFSLANITEKTLRESTDNFFKHFHALQAITQPTVDLLLIYQFISKLDSNTREKWEEFSLESEDTTLEDLFDFMQKRCKILEANPNCIATKPNSKPKVNSPERHSFTISSTIICTLCKGDHHLRKCGDFLKLSTQERLNTSRRLNLCTNCLNSGHQNKFCSSSSCRVCGGRHHTLLHFFKYSEDNIQSSPQTNTVLNSPATAAPRVNDSSHFGTAESPTPSTRTDGNVLISCTPTNSELLSDTRFNLQTVIEQPSEYVLLATAIVDVTTFSGEKIKCRVLLDSGSQSNLMTKDFADKLQLPQQKTNISVSGVGNCYKTTIDRQIFATVHSKISEFSIDLSFLIIPQIAGNLASPVMPQIANLISKVQLADPSLCTTGQIDMLLGAQVFWELINATPTTLSVGPSLIDTKFGWVLSGPMKVYEKSPVVSSVCNLTIEDQLQKFWEIEEVDIRQLSKPEEECELHFVQTVSYSDRFTVRLPFRCTDQTLGDSHNMALKQFYALERRLTKNFNLKKDYTNFMQEYIALGHMSLVDKSKAYYYMPHHGVVKETSTTTKLRVVFNASAKTTNEKSLNDLLAVGPIVQDDLFDILIRFRLFKFALTADVEKMFRQIWVHPSDRKFQNILWRADPRDPIQTYQLNTVTYGTASAPFLATRCLKEAFLRSNFDTTANIALKSFYVDDFLGGADNVEDVTRLQGELATITNQYGFPLRKWRSNCSIINRFCDDPVDLSKLVDSTDTSKTLGMLWTTSLDVFSYQCTPPSHVTSKRSILSSIAKIYDPLGLLSPITIRGKFIMQRIWQEKMGWDDPVSDSVLTLWNNYVSDIGIINSVTINRSVRNYYQSDIYLIGYCDASEHAYGACVYVGTINARNEMCTNLLCSKSRIAPLKTISIPRLELCGAVLLIELMKKVKTATGVPETNIRYYTDSTIVLAWLNSESNRHKVFVANRITLITKECNASQWMHIRSNLNPADLVSRGASVDLLRNETLWWHGPAITFPFIPTTDQLPSYSNDEIFELKPILVCTSTSTIKDSLFEKFSSLTRLIRVTAYCYRFVTNSKTQSNQRILGPLTVDELKSSLKTLLRLSQLNHFKTEIFLLKEGKPLPRSSSVVSLNPFLDNDGLLRVGGRLTLAPISYDQRHPIILPKGDTLTKLIINYEHIRLLHGGPQSILATIRLKYWPIHGRSLVKEVVRKCVRCCRLNPTNLSPLMGTLPKVRIEPSKPFSNCGIDYCGPFLVRNNYGRGKQCWKVYVAVFVCMTTKAVHLEVINDLTTAAFIATLKRVMSRRGQIIHLYSDNATTFVGARNELLEIRKFLENKANLGEIETFSSMHDLTWHFIPVRSPHFGGIWERAVKSTKQHLVRMAGNASLRHEEFMTLIIQIEGCLNSRPLIPLTDHPDDFNYLTPGHFLMGTSPTSLSEPDIGQLPINRLDRWQRVQQILQGFWKRWSVDYLATLQDRGKWKQDSQRIIKVDDLVVIKDNNLPPLKWKMARVTKIFPGRDGVIRVAEVKTQFNTTRMAIRQLCPLLPN